MYYVYLLRSIRFDQVYVGSTNNLKRRFVEHNDGKEFSTRRYKPWELIYYESYKEERYARMREKMLKYHGNSMKQLKKRIGLLPKVKSGAGFTLIEVIVMVSILAFLGSMVLNSVASQVYKGNDAKRKGDLDRLKVAIEEYEKDHNCYPPPATLCGTDWVPYLDKIPRDPKTSLNYGYEVPSGTCPYYYKLYAKLENAQDRDITSAVCSGTCCSESSYNYKVTSPNAP